MSIALEQLSAEIEQLGSEFGFVLKPDARGQCAVEVDDDLVVSLSFSPTSEYYGMHCLLVEASRELSHAVFLEALALNTGLAHRGAGTIMYVEAEGALVLGRTAFCLSHFRHTSLRDEFVAFCSQARALKEKLSAVDDMESAGAGIVPPTWNAPSLLMHTQSRL